MWKYANPGDYRLLHHHNGFSYTNAVDDYGRSPNTGCSYTTQAKEDYPIVLPDDMTEVWFKIDILVADTVNLFFCNQNQNYKILLVMDKTGWHLEADHRAYDYEVGRFAVLKAIREDHMDLDCRNATVILHIRSVKMNESSVFNLAAGCCELRINNRIVANIDNLAIFNGEPIMCSTIYSELGKSYFSDIIVSDAKVESREHTLVIPVKTTLLDGWVETKRDNEVIGYETASAGKSIVHTLDTDAIEEKLGNNISISSISLQAFDVSSNDEDVVDSIEKIVRLGGQEFVVGNSKILLNSYISDAIQKNPYTNQNWTLNDLKSTELILRSAKSTT